MNRNKGKSLAVAFLLMNYLESLGLSLGYHTDLQNLQHLAVLKHIKGKPLQTGFFLRPGTQYDLTDLCPERMNAFFTIIDSISLWRKVNINSDFVEALIGATIRLRKHK